MLRNDISFVFVANYDVEHVWNKKNLSLDPAQ